MRLWLVSLGLLPILLVGSGPGAGANTPVLHPQNGPIAINGVDGLYVVDRGTGATTLVPGVEASADAAWSPDGTRLAVTLWTSTDEAPGIYTMKPDGSDRVLVIRNASLPTWSPDGAWLAVVREDYPVAGEEGSQLIVVSADGGDERVLLPQGGAGPVFAFSPAWSPDGKRIAFIDGEGRIEVVTPEGVRTARFEVDATGSGLSWSPDSSRLAFDSLREQRNVLVVLDLATGKETVLPGEQDGARAPAWSPEGDQIAFLSMSLRATKPTTTSHSCGGEPFESHLWSMRPDGTKAHRLVKGEFYGRPSWGRAAEVASAPASVPSESR